MAISPPSSIDEEPIVTLVLWSVWRTELHENHLVGLRPSTLTGRVSSAIRSICLVSRTITTRTGRRYCLEGPSASHGLAECIWQTWCATHAVPYSTDVTEELDTLFEQCENSLTTGGKS